MSSRGSGAPRRGTRQGGRAGAAAASQSSASQPDGAAQIRPSAARAAMPIDPSLSTSPSGPSTLTAASTSTRGGASAGSSRGAKFRPKANRRTEEERQRIADEQLRIQNKKLADDARKARGRARGRGRGRGRGGFREFEASRGGGMFGPAGASGSRAGGLGGGGGVFGGGGGMGGRSGGPSGTGSSYIYADGRVEDDRINADELRGQQDHDEEKYTSSGAKVVSTKKKRPVLPVGIKREEVHEGGVELTTAEDIAAGEKAAEGDAKGSDSESMLIDDPNNQNNNQTINMAEPGLKNDDEVWTHVAPKPHEKIMIKNEHGELVEATAIDQIVASKMKQPSSPERQKKPVADAKTTRKGAPKDPEDEQIAQDMDRLVSLLTIGSQQDQAPDAEGNPPHNPLEGNLFLFQLPPVLPPLKIKRQPKPKTAGPNQDGKVKDEPTDDAVMLDQPPTNIDLTGGSSATPDRGTGVKAEDGIEVDDNDEGGGSDDKPPAGEEPLYPPEGGYVGKLVVRRSGKVELDWGGQTLEVVPGMQTNFLTTAVLVEETNPAALPGQSVGTAYGMGKIEGKFVLAPKWGEEEEWVVDPAELDGFEV